MEEVLVNEEYGTETLEPATAAYATSLACAPVITGATHEQKDKYLRMVAEEGALASYAVSNRACRLRRSTPCQTLAIKDDDDYVINGSKMWITGAGKADWFFVLAKLTQMQATRECPDSL